MVLLVAESQISFVFFFFFFFFLSFLSFFSFLIIIVVIIMFILSLLSSHLSLAYGEFHLVAYGSMFVSNLGHMSGLSPFLSLNPSSLLDLDMGPEF